MILPEHIQSKNDCQIHTERVDDIVLLIGMMVRMGLPQVLDHHIPAHWKQRELSWGWTAVIWLAYILSEGDHRKVVVRKYVNDLQQTLCEVTGQEVSELDFTDDRLGIVLKHLSQPSYWKAIEAELNQRTIRVYHLETEVVRCDATTASGHHVVTEGGLFQFGHSKDDPRLPQIKLMTGALDPLGMPLATDVVSGEQADDGLYIPIINRVHAALRTSGVLYVGDCKLSAFETRVHIKGFNSFYLCPLPQTGKTPEAMEAWIREGIALAKTHDLREVVVATAKHEEQVVAAGYEVDRQQTGTVNGEEVTISERVLVVKSFTHAAQQARGFEQRLAHAEQKLSALTPPRGRGKRQITDEETLKTAIDKILKAQRVEGFLTVEYAREVERKTKSVGRGNGGANRKHEVVERVRYQITRVTRNSLKIEHTKETFGWRAYVTNAAGTHLCLEDAVKLYRQECRIERIFHRLKNRLHLAPMYVQEPEQVTGLNHLLTLGVRVLTLIEWVVRRSLAQDQTALPGLHPENCHKDTDTPTSERLLTAFRGITLTIIQTKNLVIRHLTPLSALQLDILTRLELDKGLYHRLETMKFPQRPCHVAPGRQKGRNKKIAFFTTE
jgi:transposase